MLFITPSLPEYRVLELGTVIKKIDRIKYNGVVIV